MFDWCPESNQIRWGSQYLPNFAVEFWRNSTKVNFFKISMLGGHLENLSEINVAQCYWSLHCSRTTGVCAFFVGFSILATDITYACPFVRRHWLSVSRETIVMYVSYLIRNNAVLFCKQTCRCFVCQEHMVVLSMINLSDVLFVLGES